MPGPRESRTPIEERILRRDFGDREVIEALDSMNLDAVCRALSSPSDDGWPVVRRTFARGQGGWVEGDGRPALADDDPAVMQAIGRCAAWRLRAKLPGPLLLDSAAHPRPCGWCEYPVAELLRACDWATITSRYVVAEFLQWWQYPHADIGKKGLAYHRQGTDGVYLNERWAAFWALPTDERTRRIAAAQYPTEAA